MCASLESWSYCGGIIDDIVINISFQNICHNSRHSGLALKEFVLVTVTAGFIATTLMTIFVLTVDAFSKSRLNVIRILGTMLTFRSNPENKLPGGRRVIITGIIAHYFVGLLFTAIYVYLWENKILNTSLAASPVTGFVTGVIGITGWRLFFALHPSPPFVPLLKYLVTILLAHVVFGVVANKVWQICTGT